MDGKQRYPLGEEIIREDFYVDDLISGTNNLAEALKAKEELIAALNEGGLSLRKWTSNSQELLDLLPEAMTERSLQTFEESDATKALGLQWNPKSDKFGFGISWDITNTNVITKRRLLSEASKLFDPLERLAPTIINAKLLMQEIWTFKTQWDEEVPAPIKEKWIQFRTELPLLGKIKIDRWINYESNDEIELHGFCDASEKAYAAVVYSKIQKKSSVEVHLIVSKTRVAPIHLKTALPRLKLCGAVLLANLLKATKEALKVDKIKVTAWSDSMVTLGWLNGSPHRWKTCVANRVSEVQSIKVEEWRYVKSEDNPADCATRGVMPGELGKHHLWWTGPTWLKEDPTSWEITEIEETNTEERKQIVNAAATKRKELLLSGSSWFKQITVATYC